VSAPRPPATATAPATAAAGVAAFLAGSVLIHGLRALPFYTAGIGAMLLALTALALILTDVLGDAVHRRPSTGLGPPAAALSLPRIGVKLAGLGATVALIGAGYAVLPEYQGPFYAEYFRLLRWLVPVGLGFAPLYFLVVDRRQTAPLDGYWHAGLAVLGRWRRVDRGVLLQHGLGWLIKAFFLPLMFTYFTNDLTRLVLADTPSMTTFRAVYSFAYDTMYFIDVGLVSLGYVLSVRVLDTHLRSAEPTLLGWASALVCYEPFWSVVGSRYLAYGSDFTWGVWLDRYPLAYALWGSAILVLTGIYVWATVSFGARFSNLTHRGIITSGPYRYVRHPAYLAKNLSWWMISVPFLITVSFTDSLRRCALLLLVNLIYVVRAKTEERHLGADPTYREYSAFIDRHGLLSRLTRRTS
jgi:protein-S-isoprenylcysteine O-methyltransferase Ste14